MRKTEQSRPASRTALAVLSFLVSRARNNPFAGDQIVGVDRVETQRLSIALARFGVVRQIMKDVPEVEKMILVSELQDPSTIIAFFLYSRFDNQVPDGSV